MVHRKSKNLNLLEVESREERVRRPDSYFSQTPSNAPQTLSDFQERWGLALKIGRKLDLSLLLNKFCVEIIASKANSMFSLWLKYAYLSNSKGKNSHKEYMKTILCWNSPQTADMKSPRGQTQFGNWLAMWALQYSLQTRQGKYPTLKYFDCDLAKY